MKMLVVRGAQGSNGFVDNSVTKLVRGNCDGRSFLDFKINGVMQTARRAGASVGKADDANVIDLLEGIGKITGILR